MAIINKQSTLVDQEINQKKVQETSKVENILKPEKKTGFLKSTVVELSKVKWPNLRETLNMSGTVIVFTIVTALFFGFFDRVFTATVKYAECSSGQVVKRENYTPIENCNKDIVNTLTYKN
jgi:preprotein translocase SecE subunit